MRNLPLCEDLVFRAETDNARWQVQVVTGGMMYVNFTSDRAITSAGGARDLADLLRAAADAADEACK